MSVLSTSSASPWLRAGRFQVGAHTISYTIRPSVRSRAMRVWASPETGFVITVPLWRQDPASVGRFLRRHRRWLLRQAAWLADVGARTPKRWPYGPTLPYRGEEHEVVVERGDEGPAVQRTPEQTLLVRTQHPGLEAVLRLLKRWYAIEAARWVATRLSVLGEGVGVGWRRVSIGDSRWRWGSCSATGCLSFNFRLVMAPPEVMDYVIVHELAHRRVLSHSERFWALVAVPCPDYRRWRAWLRTHGPSLTF